VTPYILSFRNDINALGGFNGGVKVARVFTRKTPVHAFATLVAPTNLGAISMPRPVPGQAESAYLGYALINALLDTLVAKNVITVGDCDTLYREVAKVLSNSGNVLQQRAAHFVTDRILAKK
jgi:hypothetical protein